MEAFGKIELSQVIGIWSVELALVMGILATIAYNAKAVVSGFKASLNISIGGALLAVMNSASEYGFGAVIAALPGFALVRDSISQVFTNPLVNGAVTTNILAAISGSATAGMSIALSAMSEKYVEMATQFDIPLEVMHRVIAMASGGMDTLPHNGAVIYLACSNGTNS